MVKYHMGNKSFETNVYLEGTPNLSETADKLLKSDEIKKNRVDINVLKARAKAIQDKESIKNTIIIISLVVALGVIGVYFSI